MVGSSRLENVVAFQKVRKFATSRLITPAIAAGSSRLTPTCRTHSASSPVRITKTSSSDAARRTASSGTRAVGRALGADDRDRRPGRAHPQALGLRQRPRLGEPVGRAVDLRRLAPGVLGDQVGGTPAGDDLAVLPSPRPRRRAARPPRCSGSTSGSSRRGYAGRRSGSRSGCGSADRARPSARRAAPGAGRGRGRGRAAAVGACRRRARRPRRGGARCRRARSSARSTAARNIGNPVQAREHGEVFLDGDVDVEVVELRHDAHLGSRRLRLRGSS